MLVLMLPRVFSRVTGFPVAWPRLWEKLQNVSFWYVSNCENWPKSRTKCSFWCSHVSRLESVVFLWLCSVYGGSCKTSPCGMFPTVRMGRSLAWTARFDAPTCLVSSYWFPCGFAVSMGGSRWSCRSAWQAWHFVTFQHVLYRVESVKIGGILARNARFAAPTCLVSSLWFSCGIAVSMGEAAKPLLFEGFQAGCHVVLPGRRCTL